MKRKRIPKSRPIKREQAMAMRVTFQFISSKKPRVRREDETVRSVTGKKLRASRRRTCDPAVLKRGVAQVKINMVTLFKD